MGILGAGISVIKSTLTRLVPGVAGHAEDADDTSAGARAAWARVDAAKKEVAAAEAAAAEAREQHAEMQQQADDVRCDLRATCPQGVYEVVHPGGCSQCRRLHTPLQPLQGARRMCIGGQVASMRQ